MEQLFVPYKLVRKLRKKGFNENCLAFYINGLGPDNRVGFKIGDINEDLETLIEKINAPLYQQVIDWFREKHSLCIVSPIRDGGYWISYLYNFENEKEESPVNGNNTLGTSYEDEYYKAFDSIINQAIKVIKKRK